ncbi:MAG: hypothetical protein COA43_07800 [Robiginitomaculum sp.]|nr:MAG: hypothetical protein COA43_07800 [Robiginitomaculum sp.]
MMMHETPEDDMFTALLSEYSAPIKDNGFSADMMAMVVTQDTLVTVTAAKHKKIKTVIVGSSAIIGGAYAALQIPNLLRIIQGVSLPKIDITMPTVSGFSVPSVDPTLFSSSYMMAAAAMLGMMFIWLAGTLTFGNNI